MLQPSLKLSLPQLNVREFCDAFFELADLWTPSISAEEYASFLVALFFNITVCYLKRLFTLFLCSWSFAEPLHCPTTQEGQPPDFYFWKPDSQIAYGEFLNRPESQARTVHCCSCITLCAWLAPAASQPQLLRS